MFSRIVLAIRTSLLIGLAAVAVSITVGMIIGTISGFYGGFVDLIIQRIIEILRSIPTIPLWMGLAAAIPPTWGITLVYLTVTLIVALVGWTQLARELRGKIMALRREEFVTAAELSGDAPPGLKRFGLGGAARVARRAARPAPGLRQGLCRC